VFTPGNYKPSTNEVLPYIAPPSGDLTNELSRVKEAGRKVIMDKTPISDDIGCMHGTFYRHGRKSHENSFQAVKKVRNQKHFLLFLIFSKSPPDVYDEAGKNGYK
jgi:hypothetical protein